MLDSQVTTITTCWRIVRTDGVIFAFTSHDQDLQIGNILYDSKNGYTRTAITSNSDLSVDNLDVTGIIDSDAITNEDLRNGLFNFASIYIFATDWTNPQVDDLKLRRGWFGEVSIGQNGMFVTEIRGLSQALSHNYIEVFAPECKADFCDIRCKLNIADYSKTGTVFASTNSHAVFTGSAFTAPTGSTSVGAHANWRILLTFESNVHETINLVTSTHAGFAEFICWDQAGVEIPGGTAQSSSSISGHAAQKGRDGNSTTSWLCARQDSSIGQSWRLLFGSAVDIKEFMVQSSVHIDETPTAFRIEYSDDWNEDAQTGTWHFAKDCTVTWTEANQHAVWGFGSPTDEPISYPDTKIDTPPPLTGASTYIGGTVTFQTGQNRGRTMEIIGYDMVTGFTALFDGLGYPIRVGDTYTITQGCNKLRPTCKLYNNVINFRGEPDVPGQDAFLAHPDA